MSGGKLNQRGDPTLPGILLCSFGGPSFKALTGQQGRKRGVDGEGAGP